MSTVPIPVFSPLTAPVGTVDSRRYRRLSPSPAHLVWQTQRGVAVADYDQVGDFAQWPGPATSWGYGNQQHTNGLLTQDLFGPGAVTALGRPPDPNGFLILKTTSFDASLKLTDEESYAHYEDSPLFLYFGHTIVENDTDCRYVNYRYSPPAIEDGHCQSRVVWIVPPVRNAPPDTPPPLIVRLEIYHEAYSKDAAGKWIYGDWSDLSEYFALDQGWAGMCGYAGTVPGDSGFTEVNNACQVVR